MEDRQRRAMDERKGWMMARGRMLNQKISEDLEFNSMSMEAQFLFMRTLPFLDRDGLINGHPILLAGKVVSLMPSIGVKAADIIDEWVDNELVIRYKDGKTTILFFKGFSDNQVGMRYDREAKSDYAPPPGYERTSKGLKPVGNTDGESEDDNHFVTENNEAYDDDPNDDTCDDALVCGALPEHCRSTAGDFPPEIEVEIELNNQRGRVTKPGTQEKNDDDLMPGQFLRALLEGKGIVYLDPNFTQMATRMEADYGKTDLVRAAGVMHEYHTKKIGQGGRGITAPLAYMSQILAGNPPPEATSNAKQRVAQWQANGGARGRQGATSSIGYTPGKATAFLEDFKGSPR